MRIDDIVVTGIVDVLSVYSAAGRRVSMQDRQSYGLTFSLGGEIRYTLDGVDYCSDKEHALILPMGKSYSLLGVRTGIFPVINFLSRDFISNKIEVIKIRDHSAIATLFEQLKTQFQGNGGRARAMSSFYGILGELSSAVTPPQLLPALRYIEERISSPDISNSALAAECRISEVYFRRLFTRMMGTSPKQYILDMRINRAKYMLTEGRLKVYAIAEMCGFKSPYHFARIFRRRTGYTPSEYRAKYQIVII